MMIRTVQAKAPVAVLTERELEEAFNPNSREITAINRQRKDSSYLSDK